MLGAITIGLICRFWIWPPFGVIKSEKQWSVYHGIQVFSSLREILENLEIWGKIRTVILIWEIKKFERSKFEKSNFTCSLHRILWRPNNIIKCTYMLLFYFNRLWALLVLVYVSQKYQNKRQIISQILKLGQREE